MVVLEEVRSDCIRNLYGVQTAAGLDVWYDRNRVVKDHTHGFHSHGRSMLPFTEKGVQFGNVKWNMLIIQVEMAGRPLERPKVNLNFIW